MRTLERASTKSALPFSEIDYDQLANRVKQVGTDEEILQWCFDNGRRPSEDEISVWNEFMRKRGWNDRCYRDTQTAETRSRDVRQIGHRNDISIHRCRRRTLAEVLTAKT